MSTLFSLFFTGKGERHEMLSRQQVTRGVIKSLELIDVDTQHLHFATPPAGSPAVAPAMKAPAPPLPSGGGGLV